MSRMNPVVIICFSPNEVMMGIQLKGILHGEQSVKLGVNHVGDLL